MRRTTSLAQRMFEAAALSGADIPKSNGTNDAHTSTRRPLLFRTLWAPSDIVEMNKSKKHNPATRNSQFGSENINRSDVFGELTSNRVTEKERVALTIQTSTMRPGQAKHSLPSSTFAPRSGRCAATSSRHGYAPLSFASPDDRKKACTGRKGFAR